MIHQSEIEGVPLGNEPATDAWYYSQAKAAIQAEPVSFLKAVALRLQRFWAISTAESSTTKTIAMRVIMAWYVILWAGLVVQIIQSCVGRSSGPRHPTIMLWLVILAFLVMHSVYWTDTRMRAPVMPIMIVISIAGWQSVSTYLFRRTVAGNS